MNTLYRMKIQQLQLQYTEWKYNSYTTYIIYVIWTHADHSGRAVEGATVCDKVAPRYQAELKRPSEYISGNYFMKHYGK
jgi:hypothetical protein